MQKALMTALALPIASPGLKISVIGTGAVGMAVSYALMNQRICSQIALVDAVEDRVKGEGMDLEQGTTFARCNVVYSTDYAITKNSKLCIITAGTPQKPGESRLNMVDRNVSIMKSVVSQIMKHNTEPILMIIANPVDVLTYAAWKLSGLPPNRVIGSGTTLDSARFRFFIARRLGIDPASVHGFILGEHGDSSVPVWSSVTVGGVRLADIYDNFGCENDPEKWYEIHKQVVDSAYDVIKLKGYTSWAIGMTAAELSQAIVYNTHHVFPVSTLIKGCKHGEDKEVFMSVPCVLGENGVVYMIRETLAGDEREKLLKSASILYESQCKLNLN